MTLASRRLLLLAGVVAIALVGGAFLLFREAPGPRAEPPHSPPPPAPSTAPNGDTPSGAATAKPPRTHATTASAPPAEPPDRLADRIKAVADGYADLVKRAENGDAQAALDLFSAMHNCASQPRTQTALDDRAKQAEADYPNDPVEYQNVVRFMTQQFEQCSRFTTEQVDGWRKWLTRAADSGDADARRAYVLFGKPNDPHSDTYYADTRDYVARSRSYLADQLAAGNPGALISLSNAYAPYGNGIYDPDAVQQYAYLYAYCLATECRAVSLNQMQKLATALSPQDLSAATSQGQAIYKNCCAK